MARIMHDACGRDPSAPRLPAPEAPSPEWRADTLSIHELSFVGVGTARVVTGDWRKVELPSAG